MKYRGFEIVQQYVRYEVWDLDDKGNPNTDIAGFDNEFDGYQIWDRENECQHDILHDTFDTLQEAKIAIDAHLEDDRKGK